MSQTMHVAKAIQTAPVVQSNRQSEADFRDCGLAWAIGRNGIYIEPAPDYLGGHKSAGKVANSARDGLFGYPTRDELAAAYADLLTGDAHDGKVITLLGAPITQARLVDLHAGCSKLSPNPVDAVKDENRRRAYSVQSDIHSTLHQSNQTATSRAAVGRKTSDLLSLVVRAVKPTVRRKSK